ncbi:MAG: CMP/dCMP kinase [Verrucomicrobiota bacterium]|jgi:cytidylate kinase
MSAHHVVAIDGPAASGKSSVARALAKRLGYCYVNSGAMYRAVTWRALGRGVSVQDPVAVAAVAEEAEVVCKLVNDESRISIDGFDPSAYLYSDEVNGAVSSVSRVPRVREIVNAQLRHCAADRDVVIEGRDIGSVVFPETPFKFFLNATPSVRARRRDAQGQRDEIAVRDREDSSRRTAPLKIALDAEVIDTSDLTIEEVVEQILHRLTARGLQTDSAASRR